MPDFYPQMLAKSIASKGNESARIFSKPSWTHDCLAGKEARDRSTGVESS